MQTVRSPICQQNASVAPRFYSTALPLILFLFLFCSHMHSCNMSSCTLASPPSVHFTALWLLPTSGGNNKGSIEAVVFLCLLL